MAKNACEQQAAAEPEWLVKQTAGKSDAEQKIWTSAYDKLHSQNHYQQGEGPTQALTRLKEQGFLTDMSITNIPREAHRLEDKAGKDGHPKTVFTTHDEVLSATRERVEVGHFVETQKKTEQANRLAPSCESLTAALTPERVDQMKKLGLETDPKALHDKTVQRMIDDRGLHSADMERMKSFPVGAPYVATGAVTGAQMDHLMREQKALREVKHNDAAFAELQKCNPEEYKKQWQQYLKDTDVGHLLRVHAKEDPHHYSIAKIQAADDLISALKEVQKQKS